MSHESQVKQLAFELQTTLYNIENPTALQKRLLEQIAIKQIGNTYDYIMKDGEDIQTFELQLYVPMINYPLYLQSVRWHEIKGKILPHCFFCADCNIYEPDKLILHHLTYKHINSPDELKDLIPLCKLCHNKRHGVKK
jgi:hypothetical protein